MKKESKKRNIILLIVLLAVVFAGIDVFLAGLLIKNSNRTFRTSHYYYHHGLLPNQEAVASWYNIPYIINTNSLGFRDSVVQDVALKTSKKRILIMGDSHAEGVGVEYKETFAGRLSSLTDNSNTEILNASAVSYSPRIYYLKTKYLIEEVGLKFDELYVFIDLSDIQNEIVYKDFQPETPGFAEQFIFSLKNQAVNNSFTWHTISTLNQKNQTERFLKQATVFDEYRQNDAHVDALDLYASFFSEFDDKTLLSNPQFHGVSQWIYDDEFRELALKGLELGRQNMRKLSNLCREHNIKMTISVHPWQEQVSRLQPEDMYVNFWKNFAEEQEIGFINLYPVFINPPVSAAFGMEFFIPGDNHWNKNGHWLVAQEIMKNI